MIKRFMVIRNNKTLGYEGSIEEAKAMIQREYRKNKDDTYTVKDLKKDVYVCVGEFVKGLKQKKMPIKQRRTPKQRRNDVIDDQYSAWLGKQACVVTGATAKRGVGAEDMHCHHIHGRGGMHSRNDHMQVPLIGFAHSWGDVAYHNNTKSDYLMKWMRKLIGVENIIEYFEDHAKAFKEQYDLEINGGEENG